MRGSEERRRRRQILCAGMEKEVYGAQRQVNSKIPANTKASSTAADKNYGEKQPASLWKLLPLKGASARAMAGRLRRPMPAALLLGVMELRAVRLAAANAQASEPPPQVFEPGRLDFSTSWRKRLVRRGHAARLHAFARADCARAGLCAGRAAARLFRSGVQHRRAAAPAAFPNRGALSRLGGRDATGQTVFLQAVIFTPAFLWTFDLLRLPTFISSQWLSRHYGQSIQGWISWLWDWAKDEFLTAAAAAFIVWLVYTAIRMSERRWWL